MYVERLLKYYLFLNDVLLLMSALYDLFRGGIYMSETEIKKVDTSTNEKKPKKFVVLGPILLVLVAILIIGAITVDRNDIGYYKVIQTVTGNMHVRSKPGYYIKWFNTVTSWKEADTLYFSRHVSEGPNRNNSIEVRFADGGKGNVSVNVRYLQPADEDNRLELQKVFKSDKAFQQSAIEQMVRQACMTAASMTTAEGSYRERSKFMGYIIDQVTNGLYETRTIEINNADDDDYTMQEILRDENGKVLRKPRDLETYGVQIVNVNVTDLDYEKDVEEMIKEKREKAQEAELAKYKAEKARQDKLTAIEEGEKEVTIAEYEEQKEKKRATIKADKEKEVATIQAQKELEVAKLAKERAEIELETEKVKAEAVKVAADADAEAKRKLIEADGALQEKLEALTEINKVWAEAYTKQRPTPDIMMGGGESGTGGVDASTFMQIIMTKALQDLSVDMEIQE